jgi:hypothetical protein
MAKRLFNIKKEFGWAELISIIALILAGLSLYLQYNSSKAFVTLHNDKLISTVFMDKDSTYKFFSYFRATINNTGNKPVTLLGLQPHEKLGLILTAVEGSEHFDKDEIKCKIFQIPDTLLSERLLSSERNLWDFKDEGIEKLGIMNKVINPGEVYTLHIGTVYDLFSNPNKRYSKVIFNSELIFSNGQRLLFGAADVNIPPYSNVEKKQY